MAGEPAIVVAVIFLGIVASGVLRQFFGSGWLNPEVAGGATRTAVTSSLVGIAGAFIGASIATLTPASTAATLNSAVAGAVAVLWLWRMMR